jgi:hypothetical protein
MKQAKPGDTVHVRLFDKRIVAGKICVSGVLNTTSGGKLKVDGMHFQGRELEIKDGFCEVPR